MSRIFWIAAVVLCTASPVRAALTNGGFEQPDFGTNTVGLFFENQVDGWETTASDNVIELWGSGFNGVPAFEGDQFAELNANFVSTLYQDASGISAGSFVGFEFAHRGRFGVDTMRLTIRDLGADNATGGLGLDADTILFQQSYSDGASAWGFYTNSVPITALGNTVRFEFESVSAAGGLGSVGNFLDAADFGVDAGNVVPEPSSFTLLLIGSTLTGGLAMARRRRAATSL